MHNFLFVFALDIDKIDIVECISYFIIARLQFQSVAREFSSVENQTNLFAFSLSVICFSERDGYFQIYLWWIWYVRTSFLFSIPEKITSIFNVYK